MSIGDRIFSALAVVAMGWMLAWSCSGTGTAATTTSDGWSNHMMMGRSK